MCSTTLWKILRKDLSLRGYKIEFVQELNPHNHLARRKFGEWAQTRLSLVPTFINKFCLAMNFTFG